MIRERNVLMLSRAYRPNYGREPNVTVGAALAARTAPLSTVTESFMVLQRDGSVRMVRGFWLTACVVTAGMGMGAGCGGKLLVEDEPHTERLAGIDSGQWDLAIAGDAGQPRASDAGKKKDALPTTDPQEDGPPPPLPPNATRFDGPGVGSFVVPEGTIAITVRAWGGGGGGSVGGRGGGGGFAAAVVPVTAGETLEVGVGEGAPMGAGAGMSFVRRGGEDLVIAAGGGGAGSDGDMGRSGARGNGRGGAGGGTWGASGGDVANWVSGATGTGGGGGSTYGGLGGTMQSTGNASSPAESGRPGSQYRGGTCGGLDVEAGGDSWRAGQPLDGAGGTGNGSGGGGGAGYFGGGGGSGQSADWGAGGGGGSSFIAASAVGDVIAGSNDDAGYAVDRNYYWPGRARGGNPERVRGGHGYVVVEWSLAR